MRRFPARQRARAPCRSIYTRSSLLLCARCCSLLSCLTRTRLSGPPPQRPASTSAASSSIVSLAPDAVVAVLPARARAALLTAARPAASAAADSAASAAWSRLSVAAASPCPPRPGADIAMPRPLLPRAPGLSTSPSTRMSSGMAEEPRGLAFTASAMPATMSWTTFSCMRTSAILRSVSRLCACITVCSREYPAPSAAMRAKRPLPTTPEEPEEPPLLRTPAPLTEKLGSSLRSCRAAGLALAEEARDAASSSPASLTKV
mmetsp:Transcript_75308/g.208553  ORF Transcript_75308/g.208553 Transcript_75308/m.208553 type:complete len:261 (-) Transcript_75308:256-1038(-)